MRLFNNLPELHLGGEPFWRNCFCRTSHYRICPFPLCTSDKYCPHRTFRRHVQFQSSQMRLLPRKCDTRPRIDGELYHVVSVIKQELPKLSCPLSLRLSLYWQVEADYQPSHFEFLRIHGLYLLCFPVNRASR